MAERDCPDEPALRALGTELACRLPAQAVVYLEGPLGAGKTTLARALIQALGHGGAVRSPTYTLVESYALGDREVHHLDLYRVADPDELEFLGLRELATARALWLVEWAERGGDRLPPPDWVLTLAFAGQGRRVAGLPVELGHAG
jgi:tRNA threonylcarbamoyladenosine biosynthesis protein TsaE